MRLDLADELHGAHLGRSAECARGEGVGEGPERVYLGVEGALHAAGQVDDVAVILRLFVEDYAHVVAVAREVVTGQVDQHDMLRVLLRVVQERLRQAAVGRGVARASGGAGDRVYEGALALDLAVRLGR